MIAGPLNATAMSPELVAKPNQNTKLLHTSRHSLLTLNDMNTDGRHDQVWG